MRKHHFNDFNNDELAKIAIQFYKKTTHFDTSSSFSRFLTAFDYIDYTVLKIFEFQKIPFGQMAIAGYNSLGFLATRMRFLYFKNFCHRVFFISEID